MKKSCLVRSCTNPSRRWGYCALHAYRFHRYGDALYTKNEAHGGTHTNEYNIYRGMIARCNNPNSQVYCNYGGRGITVCKEWQESYTVFITDMGKRPNTTYSIDRINNDGNYEPSNCRWATKSEQCFNRRKRMLTLDGRTMSIRQWATELDIDHRKLHWRYAQGWCDKHILSLGRPRCLERTVRAYP